MDSIVYDIYLVELNEIETMKVSIEDASNQRHTKQRGQANQAGKVKKQQGKKESKICHLKLCQVHRAR